MYTPSKTRYETMSYPRCGQSGLRLPALSLGLWHNFGDTVPYACGRELCLTAFDRGVTHFDLANNYGPAPGRAEESFGKLLREDLAPHRHELVISTKAGYTMWDGPYGDGGSRKYLLSSLDESLQRMGLDYVDIFYHHRPDPNTPLEETISALAQAVASGKALYVGLSNYSGDQLREACRLAREYRLPLIVVQNRYSMLDRTVEKNGVIQVADEQGLGLVAFSPLAQGLLSDRYFSGIPADSRIRTDGRFLKESALTKECLSQLRALASLAAERGQTLAEMALAWLRRDGAVTSVLIGASKPAQIEENLRALNSPAFSEEELAAIDAILEPSMP